MFQNSYQNGTFFELFDPKLSQDKTKNLFKVHNVTANNKIFDKQLKTFILDFNAANAKIVFPREDRKQLYLIQQYLNLQVFFYPAQPWSIELAISDLTKTKRRITLSPTSKSEIKPFFVKFPSSHVQEGIWTNLAIDIYSFISAFKGQTFRSLDNIAITGHFKLRRIFTTQRPFLTQSDDEMSKIQMYLPQKFRLPKGIYFPTQIQCSNCMINYEEGNLEDEQIEDLTESVNKNKSNLLTRNQVTTPKSATVNPTKDKKGYKDEKKFLADTNGPEKNKKKKENGKSVHNKSRYTEKYQISMEKRQAKGKTVGKTNLAKNRLSVEKQKQKEKQSQREMQKQKTKNKLNPWRSQKKHEYQTDGGSQLSSTKPLNERKIESAETTLFKTKNRLGNKFNDSFNKGFDHRSDQYSDSEYVELSQKFSTITQGKFFKNQLHSQHIEKPEREPEQIQENIEVETQLNESTNRKQQIPALKIDESISDSLDNLPKAQQARMMDSYYGFGEKIVNKYMDEYERPYSPPLCEKELTEEASERNDGDHNEQQEKQVELIYDPVLNCYYDHKTHTYYELKN